MVHRPEVDEGDEPHLPTYRHDCGNLFGCGDEKGTGVLREDIKDAAFDAQAADRLLHLDELKQERVDDFLTARGRKRRQLLRASSFLGALAAVGPWFDRLAQAAGDDGAAPQTHAETTHAQTRTVPDVRVARTAPSHLSVKKPHGPAQARLARRHGNPLDAQASDTRIQVWPCKSGGICNWSRPAPGR